MKSAILLLAAAAIFPAHAAEREYTITVKNTLAREKLAPILVVGNADDRKIWVGEYVSPEARTQLGNKPALIQQPRGRGHVIAFVEDPNFRAFMEGTELLFINAVLLGPAH